MSIVVVCAYGDKDAVTNTVTPCTQQATCFVRDSNGSFYPCCAAHAPTDPQSIVVT